MLICTCSGIYAHMNIYIKIYSRYRRCASTPALSDLVTAMITPDRKHTGSMCFRTRWACFDLCLCESYYDSCSVCRNKDIYNKMRE